MTTTAISMPPIVSRSEWENARAELLVREKELMRLKDSVSAARRRLPMVEITEPYTFATVDSPASLLDLFDGRRQLIVQDFMFGTDWDEGCSGCSMMADHIGLLSDLHAKDTSFVLVSRAPHRVAMAALRLSGGDRRGGSVSRVRRCRHDQQGRSPGRWWLHCQMTRPELPGHGVAPHNRILAMPCCRDRSAAAGATHIPRGRRWSGTWHRGLHIPSVCRFRGYRGAST
jgi:hypothetical protein